MWPLYKVANDRMSIINVISGAGDLMTSSNELLRLELSQNRWVFHSKKCSIQAIKIRCSSFADCKTRYPTYPPYHVTCVMCYILCAILRKCAKNSIITIHGGLYQATAYSWRSACLQWEHKWRRSMSSIYVHYFA